MSCKYCTEWPSVDLFNNRDKLGKKSSDYPGVMVTVDSNERKMYVGASADVYEPNWVEAEFPINFCPMCGDRLGEENLNNGIKG